MLKTVIFYRIYNPRYNKLKLLPFQRRLNILFAPTVQYTKKVELTIEGLLLPSKWRIGNALQSILTLFCVGSSHAFKTLDWAKMPQSLAPYILYRTHSWYHDTTFLSHDNPRLTCSWHCKLSISLLQVASILKKMPMKIHTHIVISIINLCCYPLLYLLSL